MKKLTVISLFVLSTITLVSAQKKQMHQNQIVSASWKIWVTPILALTVRKLKFRALINSKFTVFAYVKSIMNLLQMELFDLTKNRGTV